MSLDDIRTRIAAGDTVTAAEVATATATTTLEALTAEVHAEAERQAADDAHARQIEDLIAKFAADVDRANARIETARRTFADALDKLNAAVDDLKRLNSDRCSELSRLGFLMAPADVHARTGGRVLVSLDHLSPATVAVPVSWAWSNWVDGRTAERAQTAADQ